MGKIVAIMGVCLAGLCGACGAQGGSADDLARRADENADATRHSFAVRLSSATDVENVTVQIASAGREQIAAACEAESDGSVRIYNPLASGAYEDIPCASVVGDGATGKARAVLANDASDGPIGEVQQPWSPLGVGCTLIVFGIGAISSIGCTQNYPRSEGCPWASSIGSTTIGIFLCQIL